MAAMHCVMLADHIGKEYRAPMMTVLAEKWQHSCQEVRSFFQHIFSPSIYLYLRFAKRLRLSCKPNCIEWTKKVERI